MSWIIPGRIIFMIVSIHTIKDRNMGILLKLMVVWLVFAIWELLPLRLVGGMYLEKNQNIP